MVLKGERKQRGEQLLSSKTRMLSVASEHAKCPRMWLGCSQGCREWSASGWASLGTPALREVCGGQELGKCARGHGEHVLETKSYVYYYCKGACGGVGVGLFS